MGRTVSWDIENKSPLKLVIKYTVPTIALLFAMGIYSFIDDIMSVRMASDSYKPMFNASLKTYDPSVLIRLAISTTLPIIILISSMVIVFSIGTTTFYSKALSLKNYKKADKIASTSIIFSMLFAIVIMFILLLLSDKWIQYQYHGDYMLKTFVTKLANKYISVVIFSMPFQLYSNTMASIMRANGKTIIPTILIFTSIVVNILMNYIFMSVLNFGLEGSSYATLIAWGSSTFMFFQYQSFTSNPRLQLRNTMNFFSISPVLLLPIFFASMAPFIQTVSSSITETFESHTVVSLSYNLFYNDVGTMPSVYSAMIPIYNLWSPLIFGFTLGILPIATQLFTRGETKKFFALMKTTIISMIIFGVITYFFSVHTFKLFVPLLGINMSQFVIDIADSVFRIIMLSEFFLIFISFFILYCLASSKNITGIIIAGIRPLLLMAFMALFYDISKVLSDLPLLARMKGYLGMFAPPNAYWWFYPSASFVSAILSLAILFFDKKIRRYLSNKKSEGTTNKKTEGPKKVKKIVKRKKVKQAKAKR